MDKMKKAQSVQSPLTYFIGNILLYSFVVFGIVQALAWWSPSVGIPLSEIITTYFQGSSMLFLFVAAGLIGLGVNRLALRQLSGSPFVWDSKIVAFFVFGIMAVAIGLMITLLGNTGIVEQAVVQSMLLP